MKQKLNKSEERIFGKYNRIAIADFEVESTTSSLEEVEKVINSVIETHKDFAEFRRQINQYKSCGIG